MDGVIVDFESGIHASPKAMVAAYEGHYDDMPGIFSRMQPMPGAIEAVKRLSEVYDTYILSSSPWENPGGLTDKLLWVQKYFGEDEDSLFYKKVIFSQQKHLNHGDILIDDRTKNGAGEFPGRLVLFGSDTFPDWQAVLDDLLV